MTKQELNEIVASHGRWLADNPTGERADLRNANLRDADLPAIILQVGPIGSRKDYVVYNASNDNIRCGCWNDYKGGTLAEFEARVEEVYPSEKKDTLTFRNQYLTVIGYFKTVRETCLKEETS